MCLSLKGVASLPGGQHEGERRVLWLRHVRLRGLWTSQRHRWEKIQKSNLQLGPDLQIQTHDPCLCPRSPQVRVAGVRAARHHLLLRGRPHQPLWRRPREVQAPELQAEVRAGSPGGRDLLPGGVGRVRPQAVRAAGWEIRELKKTQPALGVPVDGGGGGSAGSSRSHKWQKKTINSIILFVNATE